MIIMFIIAATTSVGAVATLYMASSYCIDACCRLRMDRINKRDKANAWNARLGRKIAQVPVAGPSMSSPVLYRPWPRKCSGTAHVGLSLDFPCPLYCAGHSVPHTTVAIGANLVSS